MNIRRVGATVVPKPLRPALRKLYNSATDRLEVLTGRRDALTPPKRMWSMVTSPELDFKEEGEGLRRFLLEKCDLRTDEIVLDVGCGIGRNAVPLIGYVHEYHGFDIVPLAIEWCKKNISRRHDNFHFELADIYNESYNRDGKRAAADYRFPYANEKFDLVFLVSVFTHMLYKDVANYLSEITRVLKPGGRCAISFLILNDESRRNMLSGQGALNFSCDLGDCYSETPEVPERAVAYDEMRVRELYRLCGLKIKEPILWGTWSSTKVMMQDIIIAYKPV